MGKPRLATAPQSSHRDDPDAISLNTTSDDYEYHDAPELPGLPPSYADSEASSSSAPQRAFIRHVPPPTASCTRTDHDSYQLVGGAPQVCDTLRLKDKRWDTEPEVLEGAVKDYARVAPIPYVYIMGTHTETVRRGDKKEKNTIVDFRVVVNIQRYLQKNFDTGDYSSMSLETVENGEKTHRGTILKARAPGVKQDIEVGAPKPTLTEWCHRYCASPRMLRIFRLRRIITGFDETQLKNRLEGAIRATNYRGHLSITFPVEDKNVDIYTCNRINEWRLKKWVCWIFYLTFLWIFTWPYLFFATKRYAVVKAEWPFSMVDSQGNKIYTTVSEEQWFEKWNVAIRRLALDRFQGEATEQMMNDVMERPADPPMPGLSVGGVAVDRVLAQGAQVARMLPGNNGGRSLSLSSGLSILSNMGSGSQAQSGWGYDT